MPEQAIRLPHYRNELLSDEVQEVISYRPHWIVRKGNILFLIIILSLLGMTWFIKYPDIVSGTARLVALNPPKLISSKTEGKLVKLIVTNDQQVHKNQRLGYLESTADYEEVMKLQSGVDEMIYALQNNNFEVLNTSIFTELSNLGELQANYQVFQKELAETKQTLSNGYYWKKKKSLEKD